MLPSVWGDCISREWGEWWQHVKRWRAQLMGLGGLQGGSCFTWSHVSLSRAPSRRGWSLSSHWLPALPAYNLPILSPL